MTGVEEEVVGYESLDENVCTDCVTLEKLKRESAKKYSVLENVIPIGYFTAEDQKFLLQFCDRCKKSMVKDTDGKFLRLSELPQDIQDRHMEALRMQEEYKRYDVVGNCPKCNGDNVGLGLDITGAKEDWNVGRCYACDYLWCLECFRELKEKTKCNHTKICHECSPKLNNTNHEYRLCGIPVYACEKTSGLDPKSRQEAYNEWAEMFKKSSAKKIKQ